MKTRFINFFTFILVIILIILVILVVGNFSNLTINFRETSTYNENNKPTYRFMIIADGNEDTYIKELELGVKEASNEYKCVYELWSFEGESMEDEMIKQFDIGIESNVHGIVIQAFEHEEFEGLLEKAQLKNVPVVLLERDIPSKEKVSVISYNQYQIGTQIGEMIQSKFSLDRENGEIVVIDNSANTLQNKARGISEKVTDNLEVFLEPFKSQTENKLNSEGITRSLLNKYSNLKVIICTSEEETLGVIVKGLVLLLAVAFDVYTKSKSSKRINDIS